MCSDQLVIADGIFFFEVGLGSFYQGYNIQHSLVEAVGFLQPVFVFCVLSYYGEIIKGIRIFRGNFPVRPDKRGVNSFKSFQDLIGRGFAAGKGKKAKNVKGEFHG